MQWFINTIVAICKAYTDEQIALLKAYVDLQDIANKIYTDEQILALKNYTDAEIIDGANIKTGTTVWWHGLYADTPEGWAVCDGDHGTPDLRAHFLRGSGSGVAHKQFGGSDTHIHGSGSGLSTGKDRTETATNIPEYYAMWIIMKI